MKSNQLNVMSGGALRTVLLTTTVCASLMSAQGVLAQEAVENGMSGKVSAVPLPQGHGPMQMTISMNPAPAQPTGAMQGGAARGPACTRTQSEQSTVVVPVGKSTLLHTAEPVRNRTLGNPQVAQATMVSPQTLYVVGLAVGTTNMIVQGKSGACEVINVVVNADSGGLQTSLSQLMPDEPNIRVATVAGDLVLAGRVSSAQAAGQAQEIAKAYARSSAPSSGNGNGNGKTASVLNMMSVDSPQQVMLEVKVAEVSKTLLNQMGAALNIQGGFGSWSGALVSSLLAGVSSIIDVNKANNRPFNIAVDAQHGDNLVKILAEPNLVTLSGQEATFLAGGKVFIPIPQSNSGGGTTITLQEEEFGVGLKFTPTVLAGGRINLKVAPEVSELSPTGVAVGATNTTGFSILPLITTRRASTTVQMNDGESFAIGGLIKSNATGTIKALPGVGEVPVLGALFRSTSFQQDLTELVFIITAHLVKPAQTASNYPLPTDSFTKPSEADVYLMGNMEGRGAAGNAKPVPLTQAPAAPAPTQQAPAPAPALAPTDAPTQAPRESAAIPDKRTITQAVPMPATVTAPLPEPHASVGAAPTDELAARVARIEAAAAQLAAHQRQQYEKLGSSSAPVQN
ncbi:type II and III secretion system protein family protein [Caballeronia sp. SEWSISQ10-4 2]|uniref:type II and III secretion system protein family protein n=1 Tax=Caballeronia sp. SEWSISQ10-4 2 TaxID=2937438 RepID=UPI0026538B13|nr:type II and III secretion system protein family protein [Caballeronia sp. SEWSISQ10-4 2]MDN7183089.1 type II and III secretion system protein family protein [Caballeronia sp. SEWSISQ10-4 2]